MDDLDQAIKDAMKSGDALNASPSLSADEKERIMNLTMNKITHDINLEKKEGITMQKLKKRLPIIIAATIGIGVVSVSAATLFHLKSPLALSVNTTSSEAASIPVAGTDIMATSVQEGITVSATQVIGDQYGFYVLVEISSPDLSDQNIDFETIDVAIEGVDTLAWDFNPISYSDHTVYAVMNIRTPANLIGKDIHISLSHFISQQKTTPSSWDLTWKLDYTDVSKEFTVNQPIDMYGGKALFENVYISPLSVYITMKEIEPFATYGTFDDTITVKLHDGTTITSNSDNTYNDTTVIGLYLGKLTDLSEIESVTFAGVEVPINSQFSVAANGNGKKLVVSNLGGNEEKINQLLQEDANALLTHINPSSTDQLTMNISYDYQEPDDRLTVTYTASCSKDGSDPACYYALSDIDLQNGSRRNCSKYIDLEIAKEALRSGQFEIKTDDAQLMTAQKNYILSLSDATINSLLSNINFNGNNSSEDYPQSFMLPNADTLLVSIPAPHTVGDHIELVITPQA